MLYRKCLLVIATALSSLLSSSASADFVNPLVPVWRGSPTSDFYGWESFTSAFGGPNMTNYPGTESAAALFNYGSGALITGTGNLYGAGGPLSVSIYAGLTAPVTEVILNLATVGTLINLDSVKMIIADNAGNSLMESPTFTELRSDSAAPGGQGQIQTRSFRWIVQGLPFAATRFQLNFNSQGANMSLDTASVDIRYTPAPGAVVVLAVAGLMGVRPRRRTQ